jgi:hypothetical protein
MELMYTLKFTLLFNQETGERSRFIRVGNLEGADPLTIEIKYEGEPNVKKAIFLDNVVIPRIVAAVNSCNGITTDELRKMPDDYIAIALSDAEDMYDKEGRG